MTLTTIKFAVVLLLVFCGTSLSDQCQRVRTVPNFKFEKYVGNWYGVSRFPGGPRIIVRCQTVTYIPNPNRSVTILEQGVNPQGQFVSTKGLATVIDPATPGVSRVVFSDSTVITQNIIAAQQNCYISIYICLIDPNTGAKVEFGLILSRRKSLKAYKLRQAKTAFAKIGVDVNQFVAIPQDCY